MSSRKTKHIKKDEIRVIKINKEALCELINETIMENCDDYFDLLGGNGAIYRISINDDFSELTICAMDFSSALETNDKLLDKYISESVSITTNSLYSSNHKRKYISIGMPPKE